VVCFGIFAIRAAEPLHERQGLKRMALEQVQLGQPQLSAAVARIVSDDLLERLLAGRDLVSFPASFGQLELKLVAPLLDAVQRCACLGRARGRLGRAQVG
jgi:hypothetical protein